MNTTLKLGGGLVAACAVCCAVSFLPAFIAGASLLAFGGVLWAWAPSLAIVAVLFGIGAYYFARRRSAVPPMRNANAMIAVAKAESCGCGAPKKLDVPVACSLGAGDFKERTAQIRDLASRSLRHAVREPLSLTLTYEIGALDEVRKLIAKERECCPLCLVSPSDRKASRSRSSPRHRQSRQPMHSSITSLQNSPHRTRRKTPNVSS